MRETLITPEEINIPTFNVPPMDAAFNALSTQLDAANSPTELYLSTGSLSLQRTLEENAPDFVSVLSSSKQILDEGLGYFLIKGSEIQAQPLPVAELAALAISSFYGEPTRSSLRDPRLVWPVQYAEYEGSELTFSQTKDEASLHTDSQYFENPEPYFGLFCMTSDEPGKGTSSLVRADEVVASLKSARGNNVLDELKKSFPFKVPPIFTETGTPEEIVVTWAPILEENKVRYRLDTLNAALKIGSKITKEQLEAMGAFNEVLAGSPSTNYHMEPGDIMFVNNHKVLHSRSAYSNPDRLLLRVRVK